MACSVVQGISGEGGVMVMAGLAHVCGNQLCSPGGFGSNFCISPGLDINNKFYYPE